MAELTREAYREFASSSDPEWWAQYEESTRQTLLADDSRLRLVAKYDDEIVGAVLLEPPYELEIRNQLIRNPYPEMRLLAVAPKYRHRGIAGLLICACEHRVRSEAHKAISLHTTALMNTAREMYERRGYQRYPDIDFAPAPGFTVLGYLKQFDQTGRNIWPRKNN